MNGHFRVVCLVALVCILPAYGRRFSRVDESNGSQRGGPPGDGPPGGRPPRGGPGHRGPPPSMFHMFESCQDMDRKMQNKTVEMMNNNEIGRHVPCGQNQQSQSQGRRPVGQQQTGQGNCMAAHMNQVRCAVGGQPSQECIDEIMNFVNGDSCNNNPNGEVE